MSYLHDIMMKLTRGLMPKGRVYKMPFGGSLDKLQRALVKSEVRLLDDAAAVNDSIIPDNDNFDEQDAAIWEKRLGIVRGNGVSFADRKAAIMRKLFGGSTRPRQHYKYIESQLRRAGFNVRIYENRFDDGMGGYETRTPADILGAAIGEAVLDGFELDEVELDGEWSDSGITICAKKLKAEDDALYGIGPNYRTTFYVAGATVDTFAEVPAARMDEFRDLLLRLKPMQCVGYLLVNYV